MEQVREFFTREFDEVMLPDLKTGIRGMFTPNLDIVRETAFVEAVATAAIGSVVCSESSGRGFFYHLPNLLHEVATLLQPHNLPINTKVVLSGDAETGVVIVGTYGTITPKMWLGAMLQTADTEFPRSLTPRIEPFVQVAKLAVKLARLHNYAVNMDSTATTTGCFMDVGSTRSKYPIVKVKVLENNANHTVGGTGKKILAFTEKACGGVETKVHDQTGSGWRVVAGKSRVLVLGGDEAGDGERAAKEMCELVREHGVDEAGVWQGAERRFRERAAEEKLEQERAATEGAAAAAANE